MLPCSGWYVNIADMLNTSLSKAFVTAQTCHVAAVRRYLEAAGCEIPAFGHQQEVREPRAMVSVMF